MTDDPPPRQVPGMRQADDDHWRRYYEAVEGRPPRPTLLRALEAFRREGVPPGLAVDLGAGTGRDSLELLRQGWRVLAIDGEREALETLSARAGTAALETRCTRFETLAALPACRLVNASFSLPFCLPSDFPRLWDAVREALEPGGRFAGQLLGPEDDWAADPAVTSIPAEGLESLLAGYDVELREEERRDGHSAKGRPKRWHLHHLVLRRRAAAGTGSSGTQTSS